MTLNQEDIAAHYQRVRAVYEELGELAGYETLTAPDFTGWYVREHHDDHDAIDDGYPQRARVTSLAGDLDTALEKTNRVLYAITSYKPTRVFDEWKYCRMGSDGAEWRTETPTPGYGELAAFPAWGDIDLDDELKAQRGSLSDSTRETIETGLAAYIDAYADLYGGRDAVYALDSVGGAYIFGAPEATLPIFEYYGDDANARERVYGALRDRTNEWLQERQAEIEAAHDGVGDVIDPDWVNNVNRQYKAPLSLHKDHDAVVTPMGVEDPSYDLTAFDAVDDSLIKDARAWAAELTSTDHRDRVDNIVEELWPTWSEAADTWQEALDSWLEHERAKEEQQRRDRDESEVGTIQAAEDASLTTSTAGVEDAIDALDIFEVADKTIVHQWTEDKSGARDTAGAGKKSFVPIWGPSAKGTANYVDEKGVWVDSGQNDYGTAVEMALIAEENWPRGEIASGEDWARGVQHLRDLGFDIPVYVPEVGCTDSDGDEYEKMPYWAVKRAAVALGVCPEAAFIEREGDDGDTYEGFPGQETYTNALEAIEEAGLQHGRRTAAQRIAASDLEGYIDRAASAQDIGEAFDSDDWARLYSAIESVADEDADLISELANQSDGLREWSLQRHRELSEFVVDGEPNVFREGDRLKRVNEEGRYSAKPLLDFAIEVESFLHLEDGSFMANVHIVPAAEPDARFEKQVSPNIFNRPQRFKDEVLAERFSTTIQADDISDEQVLDHVRKYIHSQDAPELEGTNQMGLKGNEFVTPEGVIDEDGWAEEANSVFVERDIGAERKFALSPDGTGEYDTDEVREIVELLPNTRTTERFLPALGWFYAAPFRPKIVNQTDDFNLLSVEGRSGTGKSATVGTLWKAFGMSENEAMPFSCNDTMFTLITTFASSRGVPMWLDEYKPSDFSDYQSKRLHDLLKKAATGGTEQRGNADKTTEEYHLRAPICLTGEEGVIGNAEQRRAIQTRFRNEPTEEGNPKSQRFKKLVGDVYVEDGSVEFEDDDGYDLFHHALAYYQHVTGVGDREFVSEWRDARVYIEKRLDEWGASDELDDLERQGLQTIVFGYRQFRALAKGVGADMQKLPDEDDLNASLKYIADIEGGGRESHLDRYVQLVARAAVNGELEDGTHYKVSKANDADEELRVNVSKAHDKITKYANDHDITEDLLAQAKDYRSRFKEEFETENTYVLSYSQPTPPINRAVGIDMRRAEQKLEGFDRSVFVAVENEDDDSAEGSDDDGGDDPAGAAIADIEPGYHDITATVASDVDPKPWLQAEGTLKDETGIIDYIARGDKNPMEDIEEGSKIHISNARVERNEDGVLQIELRGGVSEVKIVDEATQSGLDTHTPDGDETEAAADGGTTQLSQDDRTVAVKQEVTKLQNKGDGAGAPVEAVIDAVVSRGAKHEKVEQTIEKLSQKGEIYDPQDGHLRTT